MPPDLTGPGILISENGDNTMTIQEANSIITNFYSLTSPTDEERADFAEAMNFIYDQTGDTNFLVGLGAVYYRERMFEFALKYYELAAEKGNLSAISNLGYIWYYGRTGEKNYEKAFYYFDKAMEMGDMVAAYKVADMYKNGFYVKQSEEKYRTIIEELYPLVKDTLDLSDPLPEIFTRLARIRAESGYTAEALALFDDAKDFLAKRIAADPFFGDLSIMKFMIYDIYKLKKFDPENMDLYDLYHVLRIPRRVQFGCDGNRYEVESRLSGASLAIRFDGTTYASIDDFFELASIDGRLLTARYDELTGFKLLL